MHWHNKTGHKQFEQCEKALKVIFWFCNRKMQRLAAMSHIYLTTEELVWGDGQMRNNNGFEMGWQSDMLIAINQRCVGRFAMR